MPPVCVAGVGLSACPVASHQTLATLGASSSESVQLSLDRVGEYFELLNRPYEVSASSLVHVVVKEFTVYCNRRHSQRNLSHAVCTITVSFACMLSFFHGAVIE